MGRLLKEAARSLSKNPRRERERRSLFASIVPGGVYGGDGAIFAEENPIFQSENRFLQFPRPKIRRILAETGEGRTKAAACGGSRP